MNIMDDGNGRVRLPRLRPISEEDQRLVDEGFARAQAEREALARAMEEAKAWFKVHAREGLVIVVERRWKGLPTELYLDRIVKCERRWFRTQWSIAQHDRDGGRYYYTGQSATTPKGVTRALPPSVEVLRQALLQVNTPRIMRHKDSRELVEAAMIQFAEMRGE